MEKTKVMVVDDNELILNIVRDTLEDAGFNVITRSSALGTLSAIKSEKPHCVLMDVSMPALSGVELVKLAKQQHKEESFKIILHSAKDEEELKALANDCGADGYIKKTHDNSKLVNMVRSIIEC